MTLQAELLKLTLERARRENGGLRTLGLRFYQRLFDKYPQVRPLFHTEPEEQHVKLMASLGAIVAAVQSPDRLMPYLHAMGIRHVAYGTEEGHYAAVAENLMAVLEEHLRVEGDWTDAMRAAWQEALQAVSAIMIDAARRPEEYAPELLAAGYGLDGFRVDTDKPWELSVPAPPLEV